MNKRVTIKDIAKKCGTTANTVSCALRNAPGVSEKKAKEIRQTAMEMGYIRNSLASVMRSGQSKLIAAICNDFGNPHNATLINEMDYLLKKEGYDIMALCTHDIVGKRANMVNLAISNAVDGILFFPDLTDEDIVELMRRERIPFVLIDREVSGIVADTVRCDDYAGGQKAAEALLKAGHRKFIYIGGLDGNGAQPLRQNGFIDMLRENKISDADIRVIKGEQIYAAIAEERIYNLLQPLDSLGIFTFNDQIGYQVMNAIEMHGCLVPENVSVIGFDHIRDDLSYLQPLSTIGCVEKKIIAERAVSLLLRRINFPDAECRVEILPVALHEPESTIKNS